MDDERKAEIAKLAGEAHDKRRYYEMLGMMNTPSDPDAKREAAIAYAIAQAEMFEAKHLLERAQQPVIPMLDNWNKAPNSAKGYVP